MKGLTMLHEWHIDATCSDPGGSIKKWAYCKKCGIVEEIRYRDLLPETKQIDLFHSVPLDQFDMTMAVLLQSRRRSLRTDLELGHCRSQLITGFSLEQALKIRGIFY